MKTRDHVIGWFEAQTEFDPYAIAIEFGDTSITYSELNERANLLSHFLIEQNQQSGTIIGLCLERSFELIVSVLAILKSGAAYLPIDPAYPADRIRYMIELSGIKTILTDRFNRRLIPGSVSQIIDVERINASLQQQSKANPGIEISEDQLIYILFTSGSTGLPKGVALPHRALTNLIKWQTGHSGVGPGTKTLQFSPISFDASFWEIFTSLTTGGTLVLIENELRLDPYRLLDLLAEKKITHLDLPFVSLNYLAEAARKFPVENLAIQEVYSTAEQMRITPAIREWFKKMPDCILENQYGPTETHVITYYRLKEHDWDGWPDLPPIGKPIDGCEVILDDNGEMLLGGLNLAEGYLNRPDLTAERFIPHPNKPGERIYRSGDLGCLDEEGQLICLGRMDHQVKVRGFRIELGEVELALQKIQSIRDAAATVFTDGRGNNRLVAYLVGNDKISVEEIRKQLTGKLPEYMIPSAFIFIDKVPLSPSGKLDKKSLPTPWRERPPLSACYVPPRTDLAKKIANIWEELLIIKGIGVDDNFFDLGGNSLLSIQCVADLKDLNIDLPVVKLYQYPTIRGIEEFLSQNETLSPCDLIRQRGSQSLAGDRNPGIAIVGMSGRFPGASSVAEFWQLLLNGEEGITFFTDEELHPSIPASVKNHPDYVKARGIIKDFDTFDAAFFGMSPIMAELMDPQQRKFLEVAWEAMEDAATDPSAYKGLIGVYAGVGNNTYYLNNVLRRPDRIELAGDFQAMVLNEKDYIATRTAFTYNLKGPAISLYSACSTSLTAIAEACMSLRDMQCDTAIAGGASITCPVQSGYLYNEGGMLSVDGHCRPFDAQAAGTTFNDGVGAVVLKRLDDALRDKNNIYAVIRGVGISNDGSGKASFTAPSVEGQAATITLAQIDSGVDPGSMRFIETHGTATPLGDPVEVEALSLAYGKMINQECFLGSVKSNIGHLTPAAGTAGIIKTALALKTGILPATINHSTPNPRIELDKTHFKVNTQNIRLEAGDNPIRAAVSSFGVGGTNVHLILEEPPACPVSPLNEIEQNSRGHLLLFSAKSEESLSEMPARLAAFIRINPTTPYGDIAFTLQTGRARFANRLCAIIPEGSDGLQILDTVDAELTASGTHDGERPEIVFMFPGQGSQYVQMGRNLYESEPVFREAFDRCCDILTPIMEEDIRTIIFAETTEAAEIQLKNTRYTQPALFVIEYSLARLWMSWGILPDALIGHSIGEFVAACLAEVYTLDDALLMVAKRAALMQNMPRGIMLSVRSTPQEIENHLSDNVCLAAWNGPKLTVLSGPDEAILHVAGALKTEGIPTSMLHTSHAFHSSMMDPVLPEFAKVVEKLTLKKPRIPFISTVTGTWISDLMATDHSYWINHLRVPVRFAAGIKTLLDDGKRFLLEVGPRNTLVTLARQQASGKQAGMMVASMSKTSESGAEKIEILKALGKMWISGIEPDWNSYHKNADFRKIALPAYPFKKTRYWVEPPEGADLEPLGRAEIRQSLSYETPADATAASSAGWTGDQSEKLSSTLIRILEESSGIEIQKNEVRSNFLELGLDSLLLTQIAITLSRKFDVRITFRQLNEELSSIEKLVNFISEHSSAIKADQHEIHAQTPPLILPNPVHEPDEAPSTDKPFGAIARIETNNPSGLTDKQDQFIRAFTVRYNSKTAASKEYTVKNRKHLADPRVVTGFKPATKELIYQVVVDRSHGCRMWDIDGNEYIDVLSGFGSNMFGNTPDFIVKALEKQIHQGYEIGPQHPLAGEVCQMICEMTGFDRAALCNTGSEAVIGALRMARTVTGRMLVVLFSGSYHGISDEVIVRGSKKLTSFPAAPGIPKNAVESTLVLDYGTDESLRIIEQRADEIAAVLVEPVQSRRPDFRPVEFLKKVRQITEKSGSALIFDEVITGFRSHPNGTQGLFGIKADIGTYGKVFGGGMPVGAMAGISKFMDSLDGGQWQYGNESIPEIGVTYFAGTFVRHPLTLAACKASLEFLRKGRGQIQEELNAMTDYLAESINALCKKNHWPIKVKWFGSLFKLFINEEIAFGELIFPLMRYHGLHILEGFPNFMTTAHTREEVDKIIAIFEKSARELDQAGFYDEYKTGDLLPEGAKQIPLTDSQREIWLSLMMDEKGTLAYNESLGIILSGNADLNMLKEAVSRVMNRHESLRATFSANGEKMIIHPESKPEIPILDFSGIKSETKRQKTLDQLLETDATTPFDLVNGPLFRTQLVKLTHSEVLLQMTGHHIVVDGWSFGIIAQDISKVYSSLIEGKTPDLVSPVSFSQYSEESRKYQKSDEYKKNQQFWVEQYEKDVPVLDLPVDYAYPRVKTFEGNRIDIGFDMELAAKIRQVGSDNRSSFVNTLMALFELMLYRLTRQTSITLGLPAAGQSETGYYNLVGHCVNLLPLRCEIDPDEPFNLFLQRRRDYFMDALEHQRFTFSNLLSLIRFERDPSRLPPLIPVVFNIDMGIDEGVAFKNLDHRVVSNPRRYENFELFLNVTGTSDAITFEYAYNTAIFKPETIQRIARHFEILIKSVVENPNQPVGRVSLLSEEEYRTIIDQWSGIQQVVKVKETVWEVFEETAKRFQDKPALLYGDHQMSYAELKKRAEELGVTLKEAGVGKGDPVGIFTGGSISQIIAILATIHAGGVYVPLDPEYPDDRIRFIIADTAIRIILHDHNNSPTVELNDATRLIAVNPPSPLNRIPHDESTHNSVALQPSSPLYIMYTSGSTGTPKGVVVPHKAVIRLVKNTNFMKFDESQVFVQLSNISFDAATLEVWGSLLNGGKLVMPDLHQPTLSEIAATIDRYQPTALWLTSGLFNVMIDKHPGSLKNVDQILSGGDVLSLTHVKKAFELVGPGHLINGYGPTENTTFSTTCKIDHIEDIDLRVPIGRPIPHSTAYILDESVQPVPAGIPGILYVGGEGLALGYLNQQELSNQRFIRHPFIESEKLYNTGDVARWLPDGNIEFIGRADQQVKIRGFRVEPGEIESRITSWPGVRESAVMVVDDPSGMKQLAGFVVWHDPEKSDLQKLRQHLEESLPSFMVPAFMIEAEVIPLTGRGKADRLQLLKLIRCQIIEKHGISAPSDDIERFLCDQWSRLLQLDQVGIENGFFDLGGHSLIAVVMMSEIEERFGLRMPLSVLFEHNTIEKLAAVIRQGGAGNAWRSLVPIKPLGSRQPLFIVHGAGLNVMLFNTLTELLHPDQPVFGLQARGLDGKESPLLSIEEMAAHYIREIESHQPKGPYSIAGFSVGGFIAYEMAQQWRARKVEVNFLGMFDTDSYTSLPYSLNTGASVYVRKMTALYHTFRQALFLGGLFITDPVTTFRYKFKSLKRRQADTKWEREYEKVAGGLDAMPEYLQDVKRATIHALHNYRLEPYYGDLDVFMAKKKTYYMEDFKYYGWNRYVKGDLRIHLIPGDHSHIFHPPNNKVFADSVQNRLDKR